MTPKKLNLLKFAAFIGLPVIVLCMIAFGSLREVKSVPEESKSVPEAPERDETMIKVSLVTPIKINVSMRDSIVDFAEGLLGTPYVGGACSADGFDCSGLVYYVFQHFKITVPRSSSQFEDFGKEIPIDSVKKGDILVFLSPTRNAIGHVGIVTNPKGRESDFIHSSSGSEMKVIISSLKQEGYTRRFVKAVDVF